MMLTPLTERSADGEVGDGTVGEPGDLDARIDDQFAAAGEPSGEAQIRICLDRAVVLDGAVQGSRRSQHAAGVDSDPNGRAPGRNVRVTAILDQQGGSQSLALDQGPAAVADDRAASGAFDELHTTIVDGRTDRVAAVGDEFLAADQTAGDRARNELCAFSADR